MVEARRVRRRAQDARQRQADAREAALRAALARPPVRAADAIDRLLAADAHAARVEKLRELLAVTAERAPRLVRTENLTALKRVADADWVRPLAEWRPAGKGQDRLFRSLGEHLLARYPMPPFLWSAFFAEEGAPVLARVAVHLAAGGSLYQAVKSGLMPVPLTRAMCHELLSRGGEAGFLAAVRKVQVRAAGGSARLFAAWIGTRAGRRLHAREDEEFWQTVLAWFCANPMVPQADVAPLVDYIEHRRAEAPGFSIKGRSVLALMRALREWHGHLAREKASAGRTFPPCGLKRMDIDQTRVDGARRQIEVWHFREILDAATLADEGRAMGHCVFAYAPRIERGECAIWTLTLEDNDGHWRRLTIEVRPALRQIVQARGRFNRLGEPRDLLALNAWATRNELEVRLGAW
jgi:hypothetical protein